jgi:hypothetical protein
MKQFVRTGGSILLATMMGMAVASAAPPQASPFVRQDLIDDLQKVPGLFPPFNEQVCLNRWLAGDHVRSRKLASERLSVLLGAKIDELTEALGLSETTRRNLALAGRGDTLRFLDRVDEIAGKYHSGEFAPEARERFRADFSRLTIGLRGAVFDGDSLFAKTLAKSLTATQTARYERFQRDRWLSSRESVRAAVIWLSRPLGLDNDRRERLLRLVLEKAPRPRIYGYLNESAFSNLVLLQMSRLPEASLKPLFDATRWQQLQRSFKHLDQVVLRLRENGILLDDDGSPDQKK